MKGKSTKPRKPTTKKKVLVEKNTPVATERKKPPEIQKVGGNRRLLLDWEDAYGELSIRLMQVGKDGFILKLSLKEADQIKEYADAVQKYFSELTPEDLIIEDETEDWSDE